MVAAAAAQPVTRRLLITVDWGRRHRPCGVSGGRSGTKASASPSTHVLPYRLYVIAPIRSDSYSSTQHGLRYSIAKPQTMNRSTD